MGRVKTQMAKRVTYDLMDMHGKKFTKEFEKNKQIVKTLMVTPSNKIINIVSGYITRLIKKGHTSTPRIHYKSDEHAKITNTQKRRII